MSCAARPDIPPFLEWLAFHDKSA